MSNKKPWIEVVVSDIHLPKQNKEALSCVYQTLKLIKPDGITLNGDIIDFGTFSRHDRFSPPKCYWTDSQYYEASQKEYEAAETFLSTVDKLMKGKRKRYELGNHEQWLLDFIKESPNTRTPSFSLECRLHLTARGYNVYKYNDFMKLGKLWVTHGIYSGANHAKKHLTEMGTSILYGHLHNIEVASKITPQSVSHMAWCAGCLCDLNPDYLRNKPQNWNHGFAIVYVWPSGEYQVDIIRIQNGRCVVQGREIVGRP